MGEEKPWTNIEKLVLIHSSRETIPEIAEALGRPIEDVIRKFGEIHTILEKLFEIKAERYMEMGYEEEEAFLKVAGEKNIDLKKLRELFEHSGI